jgi:hypothetical protein
VAESADPAAVGSGGSSGRYTTVEDETLADGVHMATWTMAGMFDGAPFSAPGMSIVKFVDGTTQSDYSRDYYTEGDVMTGVPELADAVLGFRVYYRCVVDPTFVCPSEIEGPLFHHFRGGGGPARRRRRPAAPPLRTGSG